MTAPMVVFAVGNPSRGDDAIGPVICGRLAKWLENEELTERVELIEDFQLNIEHALDLQGRRRVLFVDASLDVGHDPAAPCSLERTFAAKDASFTTHAMSPQAVLQVYA